jgi:hypothetical protein
MNKIIRWTVLCWLTMNVNPMWMCKAMVATNKRKRQRNIILKIYLDIQRP